MDMDIKKSNKGRKRTSASTESIRVSFSVPKDLIDHYGWQYVGDTIREAAHVEIEALKNEMLEENGK